MTLIDPDARRVQAALAAAGSSAEVRELADSTRTARDAATALGVDVGQIVKSLVFLAGDEPVLVLIGGADRVDPERVAAITGRAPARAADPDTVRRATGFSVGGVSPVGHQQPLLTLIDRSLTAFDEVWAAGGTSRTVFPTSAAELVAICPGELVDVAATSGER